MDNLYETLKDKKIGFALTGSFCTFAKAFETIEELIAAGASVTPLMSFHASAIDTRFGKANEHKQKLKALCGKEVIDTIEGAEPIGPQKMFDILIIAPCTGNTLAKLALGITDTPITMAAKSHIRNQSPVLIAPSTNDGLANSAKNIGALLNMKSYYFVPYGQDDSENKPRSLVSDFAMLPIAAVHALKGVQYQSLLI